MTKVIFETNEIPIQPDDINTSLEFGNVFGEAHAEWAAKDIVVLCQRHGAWQSFTKEELLMNRLLTNGVIPVQFSILLESQIIPQPDGSKTVELGGGWIIKGDDERYRVTDDFVFRCYRERPARLIQGV